MKKLFKRCLATVLSFAMAFTLLPASQAKAADAETETFVQKVSKMVASGGQGGLPEENTYIVAITGGANASGDQDKAAYESGVTASEKTTVLGSARVAGMGFALPELAAEDIERAVITINVPSVNGNMSNASDYWTKAGLFAVDADKYAGMTTDPTTFPAKNNDYSKAATVFCEEKIQNNTEGLGKKTFDVTDWVKAAVTAGDAYAVFRLQTVMGGWHLYNDSAAEDQKPTLSIETTRTLSDDEAVKAAADALSVPAIVRSDLTLPTEGGHGTAVKWSSSMRTVISNDGKVAKRSEDTQVTLTATVSKGAAVTVRQFTVTVPKKAAAVENLLASYEFGEENGKIVAIDVSDNGYDGELLGSGASVTNGMLFLPGGANNSGAAHVKLPGNLFAGNDTLTITTWLKNETGSGDYAAMFFGTKTKHVDGGASADKPLHYWLLNPAKGGAFKSVWTNGDDANSPWNTETAASSARTDDAWGLYTTVITPNEIVGYYNGTEVSRESKSLTTTSFGTDLVGLIGRSSYNDPYYKGGVYGVKVYDKAFSAAEVLDEYYENCPPALTKQNLFNAVKKELEDVMLGENESKDMVTKDLSFPSEIRGIKLTWTSSDEVIGADGKLKTPVTQTKNVAVTVTGKLKEETAFTESYAVTVMNEDDTVLASVNIPNADNIKGNITLPSEALNGAEITWESSNPAVVSVTERENDGYDNMPAGVVTRGQEDVNVTLTAKVTVGGAQKTKQIPVTVKAATETDAMDAYMIAYFVGDGAGQERIFFAASEDGMNWTELNGAEPIFISELGEKGLRDPFIARSPEGDKFYMIATDLCIGAGKGWDAAQKQGSQAIMVWESDDLVNWSDQRMVTVSAQIEAGCTWAPEFFYDKKTGEYIVFWASKVKEDNYAKQRLYYAKTRDFYTFTEPQVWIDKDSISTIDTTVVYDDDTQKYYRFTKNENGDAKYIFMEKADSMLGEWTSVTSPTLEAEKWVEGPCCFKFNDGDGGTNKWCVLLDDFGGVGYYPIATTTFSGDTVAFTKLEGANLPKVKKPRHGTVMNITAAEYQALTQKYTKPELTDSFPSFVKTGYTLPATVDLKVGAEVKQNVPITWEDADFTKVGAVTVTGTVASMNNATVTAQIEVVSDKLIYLIDSGVGEWNENRQTSKAHESLKDGLRNKKPDQKYEGDAEWGIAHVGTDKEVKPESGDATKDVACRANAGTSIYDNGWWAGPGKKCDYIIPLEEGVYSITGYFGEWWGQSRPMNFYAEYKDSKDQTQKSEVKAVALSGSNANIKATFELVVQDIKAGEKVHIYSEKTGSNDAVIAGLEIEKLSTLDEYKAAAAQEALDAIEVAPKKAELMLNGGELARQEITVTMPDDLMTKLNAAGYETLAVDYKSSDATTATVQKAQSGNGATVTAVKEGAATITATFTAAKDASSKDASAGAGDALTATETIAVTVTSVEGKINAVTSRIQFLPEAQSIYVDDEETVVVVYPEDFEAVLDAAGLEVKSIAYESSAVAKAEVNFTEGKSLTAVVKGVAKGSADIKATITVGAKAGETGTITVDPIVLTSVFTVDDGVEEAQAAAEAVIAQLAVSSLHKDVNISDTTEISIKYPSRAKEILQAAGYTSVAAEYTVLEGADVVQVETSGEGLDAKATVKALKKGTAKVKAKVTIESSGGTTVDPLEWTVNINTTVSDAAASAADRAIRNIKMDPAKQDLYVGQTADFKISYPSGFEDALVKAGLSVKSLTYSVEDAQGSEGVLDIKTNEAGEDGVASATVTAKKDGSATVKATVTIAGREEDIVKEVTAAVAVQDAAQLAIEKLSGVTVSPAELNLVAGNTGKIAISYPEGLDDLLAMAKLTKTASFNSGNTAVATVDANGTVTAVAEGTAKITASVSLNDAKKTSKAMDVTVKVTKKADEKPPVDDPNPPAPAPNPKLSLKKMTIGVGETVALKVTGHTGSVKWTQKNKKIATVKNGKVTGKKAGKTTVTAQANGKKLTCTVTVKNAPKKVTVKKKSLTLKKGKTAKITYTLTKNSASYKIDVKSSKKNVVAISKKQLSTGKGTITIKAKKKGKSNITITTFKKKVKATVKVTVK